MTGPTDFEQEHNVPPALVDPPGTATPIGSIIWLNLRAQTEWEIPVLVRDENVEDDVEVRWRVVTDTRPNPPFTPYTLPVTNQPLRDEYTIRLTLGDLSQGRCHRLELIASSSFVSTKYFDAVLPEDDLARAVWWLWDGNGEDGTMDADKLKLVDSCDAVTALLEGSTAP